MKRLSELFTRLVWNDFPQSAPYQRFRIQTMELLAERISDRVMDEGRAAPTCPSECPHSPLCNKDTPVLCPKTLQMLENQIITAEGDSLSFIFWKLFVSLSLLHSL